MVHCYKLGGLNIVLDICSGSVHVVDEVVYDVIEAYESRSKEEIIAEMLEKYAHDESVTREELEGCFEDIEELKAEGKLFSPDNFEGMAGKLKEKSAGVVSFTRTAGIKNGEAIIKDDIVLDTEREIDFRLITHVEPKIIEEGKVALTEGRTLIHDKSLKCEIETFDPVKADTVKSWGTPVLYRIHLTCRAQEFHGEMRFI